MSLHTYYVFFFTIVSLKQRIQSNKSKKILLGVLEGQMGKPPRRGSLPSGGIPPFRHEIPLERGIQVQTSLKKMGTEHALFRPVFFNVGVPCCSKAKPYVCLRITFIYMYMYGLGGMWFSEWNMLCLIATKSYCFFIVASKQRIKSNKSKY